MQETIVIPADTVKKECGFARENCGFFDFSNRGAIRLAGKGANAELARILQCPELAPGMVADNSAVTFCCMAQEDFLLVCDDADGVFAKLKKEVQGCLTLENLSAFLAFFVLAGAKRNAVLADLGLSAVPEAGKVLTAHVKEIPVIVYASGKNVALVFRKEEYADILHTELLKHEAVHLLDNALLQQLAD